MDQELSAYDELAEWRRRTVAEGGRVGAAEEVAWLCERLDEARRGAAPDEPRRHGVLVSRPTWLSDTETIQREVFRQQPRTVAYVRDQVTAAVVELAELLQNLPWKSARDGLLNQGDRNAIEAVVAGKDLLKAQEELIDVAHFVANIAVAVGLDDRTFWQAYNEKSARNVERRVLQEEEAAR